MKINYEKSKNPVHLFPFSKLLPGDQFGYKDALYMKVCGAELNAVSLDNGVLTWVGGPVLVTRVDATLTYTLL